MSIKITAPNSINNPMVWIIFSVSRFIGFFLIASIVVNTICAPSKAGIGNMLNIARFADIKGIRTNKFNALCVVKLAIVAIVVIGPPIEEIGS